MKQKGFRWLTGDQNWTDYGGTWIRPAHYSNAFEVVRFMPWAEMDSSAIETHGKYNVQAAIVDLDSAGGYQGPHGKNSVMASRSTLENALRFCGYELQADGSIENEHDGEPIASKESEHYTALIVECLFSYGHKDVTDDFSGNNAYRMLRMVGVHHPNAHLKPSRVSAAQSELAQARLRDIDAGKCSAETPKD